MTQEKYKYLAYAYETKMPEVAGKDYPLATLLYTPDAAKTVGLSNQNILGGITGLTATMAGSDTINLSWTAVPGTLGYNVYRSTAPDGTFTKINSAPITAVSYADTGLTSEYDLLLSGKCSRRIDVRCGICNNRRNWHSSFGCKQLYHYGK